MKLIFQGKQMRISEGLRRYAEEHVLTPLRRFYDNQAAELRVEVGRDNANRGESRECHLTLHMPGAKTIQAAWWRTCRTAAPCAGWSGKRRGRGGSSQAVTGGRG
jgi:ribosome-associated translation inhibitor RaiA